MPAAASFDVEQALWADGARWVVGLDEVGRGCAAGPLVIGAAAATADMAADAPPVADSKLVAAHRRDGLADAVRAWCPVGLGWVSAAEIDDIGMAAALRLAAARALDALTADARLADGLDAVIQDGSASWLPATLPESVRRIVRPKADRDCATVAAASLVAKVARDAYMVALAERLTWWGFERHVGYLTPEHLDALHLVGPSDEHRVSWKWVDDLPWTRWRDERLARTARTRRR